MQRKLSGLKGQNLLLIDPEEIEEILDKNKLISRYTIQKKYPNTVNISLKEVSFVANIFKGKKNIS